MHRAGYQQHGFTIVELLVVIVVIGILAAITVVSYTGISQKAIVVTLQSDLMSGSDQLKIYQVFNSQFPGSVTDCPNPAQANICLKLSGQNSVSSYTVNNGANPQTFTLVIKNGSLTYQITDNTGPVLVIANPITAIAAIVGTPQVGQVLTAGALTPSGATASYQWQSSATSGGTYTSISGATSSTYAPVSGDVGNYLKVVATGTGSYSGSATSTATTAVTILIVVTGGNTVATDGLYTVRMFTSSGTLTVTGGTISGAQVLVVGGGGGGGQRFDAAAPLAAGGGAGGLLYGSVNLSGNMGVTVGGGGAGGNGKGVAGASGNSSVFGGLTAFGGGYGAAWGVGGAGGSGGGGTQGTLGGAGTSGQGYAGQGGNTNGYIFAGGGGGAGGTGLYPSGGNAPGGVGVANSISGVSLTYAKGGVGGASPINSGAANTGNGGDGGAVDTVAGGSGGSGIVIIRYLTP